MRIRLLKSSKDCKVIFRGIGFGLSIKDKPLFRSVLCDSFNSILDILKMLSSFLLREIYLPASFFKYLRLADFCILKLFLDFRFLPIILRKKAVLLVLSLPILLSVSKNQTHCISLHAYMSYYENS